MNLSKKLKNTISPLPIYLKCGDDTYRVEHGRGLCVLRGKRYKKVNLFRFYKRCESIFFELYHDGWFNFKELARKKDGSSHFENMRSRIYEDNDDSCVVISRYLKKKYKNNIKIIKGE